MSKLYALAVIILIIVAGYLASTKFNPSEINTNTLSSANLSEQTATLRIDFGDGTNMHYDYEIQDTTTAFDLLNSATDEQNITVDTTQYDFGVLINSIGDKENTKELAWIYFVNGEAGNVAADNMILESGDVVEWKYTKPSF